jgi:AraC family transcriptional regulator
MRRYTHVCGPVGFVILRAQQTVYSSFHALLYQDETTTIDIDPRWIECSQGGPPMSMNSPALTLGLRSRFAAISGSATFAATNVRPLQRREEVSNRHGRQNDRTAAIAIEPTVDISPREIANRRAKSWDGMAAEIVQATRRARIDIHFRAPVHLLVVVEQGIRLAGETLVEGLPQSTLKDLRRKLTFVPAGHHYHEWQEPSVLPRVTYFYFDPATLPVDLQAAYADALRAPRLFFEDTALWETALKLRRLMESPGANSRLCFEALGVILMHELVRPTLSKAPARGGLAAWQQRILLDYIEENLAEQIPLATLAQLVQLSPYHLCRAFKQSFGMPPHRYHTSRRIERAKALLAKPDYSVTDIGMTVGFSETSSFTAAFRRATGLTPTAYHRSLEGCGSAWDVSARCQIAR